MSLRPAGNIQLRVPHRPIDLPRCCDGCIEEDGTNHAPPGHPTPNTAPPGHPTPNTAPPGHPTPNTNLL